MVQHESSRLVQHEGERRMSMDKEIGTAVELVCMSLRGRLTSEVVAGFGVALGEGMRAKYSGHWYPDRPSHGMKGA